MDDDAAAAADDEPCFDVTDCKEHSAITLESNKPSPKPINTNLCLFTR